MKKKILKNLCIGLAILVVSALFSAGIVYMLLNRNVTKTGNLLGISWYNETDKEFTISTTEELYEFARLSTIYNFKGQTIKLDADIVINEGNATEWEESKPERKWTPIDGFNGTFDGQGHTISGLYAKGYNAALALFTNTKGGSTIQNFRLVNSYLESRGFGGVASVVSNGGGKIKRVYSDAIIVVNGEYSSYSGGICSKLNMTTTIEECWYDGIITTSGRNAGGIVDDVIGSNVTMSNCLFSGEINGTWDYSGPCVGGLVGRTFTEGASLTMKSCLSSGTIKSGHNTYTGGVLGNSVAGTTLNCIDTYIARGTYPAIGSSGLNGNMKSLPLEMNVENLVGYKAYQWTNLDFEKCWSVVENGTPILTCFADDSPSVEGMQKAYDISWYSETSGGEIKTLEQLYGFYILSGSTNFQGETVKLGADLVLNEGKASDWLEKAPSNVWSPVNGFAGNFDGQGHTISGLYINCATRYVGFFGMTNKICSVKNIRFENGLVVNHSGKDTVISTGSVAGVGHGRFENIYSNVNMDTEGFYMGGLFGQIYQETVIADCWYDGTIKHNGRYAGGLIGLVSASTVKVEHCLNSSDIEVIWEGGYCNSGGLIGATMSSDGIKLSITDCLNVGTIKTTTGGTGSILGHCVRGVVTITDTYALKGSNLRDGKALGHKQSTVNGGGITLGEELLTGYNAYSWSNLDFENHWAIVLNGTPMLKNYASNIPSVAGCVKAFDISWYDEKSDVLVIKNAKELFGFYMVSCTTNLKGKTVQLGADITVNTGDASTWTTEKAPTYEWISVEGFAGTFDGKGHTISGIYINESQRYIGFFASTTVDAVVKNLYLKNSKIINHVASGALSTGSISGSGAGTFDTIYSNAYMELSGGTCAGGIIGQVSQQTTVKNCQFDGVFENVNNGRYSGGIVGAITGKSINIEHCLNSGTVKIERTSGYANSGGIIGASYYGDDMVINITDCFNSGTVISNQGGVGSIMGQCVKGTVNIKNVFATSDSNNRDGAAIGANQGVVNGGVIQFPESMMRGTDGYRTTYLDFAKYWSAIENETPQLKSFAGNGLSVAGVDKLFDTSWYNDTDRTFTLTSTKQLYGFTVLSANKDFAGKTIKLGATITLNEGDADTFETTPPKNAWVPIGKFAGTFDGQGNSIKGLYIPSGSNVGLFSETTNTAIVKNLKLEEAYVLGTSGSGTGSVVGRGGGSFSEIYSDAIVKTADGFAIAGGIIGYINKDATFDTMEYAGHLTVATNRGGGIAGDINNATALMKNCHISGTVESAAVTGHMNLGMMAGRVVNASELTIENCFISGYLKHNHPGTTSTANRMYANMYVGKMEGKVATIDVQKCIAVSDADHWPKYYEMTQTTKTEGHDIWKQTHTAKKYSIAELTGVSALTYAERLGFSERLNDTVNKWVIIKDGTPQLRIFATGTIIELSQLAKPDTTWYTSNKYTGEKTDPYMISTPGELLGLSELVSGGVTFKDKYIALKDDIIYNPDAPSTLDGWKNYELLNTFEPIGTKENAFQGTFDGQGNDISGIYISGVNGGVGLFGYTAQGSMIKNLNLVNSYIKGGNEVGSIVGVGKGNVSNVTSNALVIGNKYIGGIVGNIEASQNAITDAEFTGYVETSGGYTGGIVGNIKSAAVVNLTRCTFSAEGKVDGTNKFCGGIVGVVEGATVNILKCASNGITQNSFATSYSTGTYAGGIIGRVLGGATANVTKSRFSGTVTGSNVAPGGSIGGAVGNVNGDSTLRLVEVLIDGDVIASQESGGIVGSVNGTGPEVYMTDCHFAGRFETKLGTGHQSAGALVGHAYNSASIVATRCLVTGSLKYNNNKYACKLVGKLNNTATFDGSGGVYIVDDDKIIPSTVTQYLQAMNATSGWAAGKENVGISEVTTIKLTGVTAVGNVPLLGISTDPAGNSTWVATKTGFPTLRHFVKESDIYIKTP